MKFTWDESKNITNVKKHKIDFTDAITVFELPMLSTLDCRTDYGEDRWVGIGFMREIVIAVVFKEMPGDVIKIISARKATSHEEKKFQKILIQD